MININKIKFGAVLSKIISEADFIPKYEPTKKETSFYDKQIAAAKQKMLQNVNVGKNMYGKPISTQPGIQMRS